MAETEEGEGEGEGDKLGLDLYESHGGPRHDVDTSRARTDRLFIAR